MNKNEFSHIPLFDSLDQRQQKWLVSLVHDYPFSFQQIRMLVSYCVDMACWEQGAPERFIDLEAAGEAGGKGAAKILFQQIKTGYEKVKNGQKRYPEKYEKTVVEHQFPATKIVETELTGNIMGRCPVASEKTRCCNLKTLDAVQQCGFSCSYCSIQSFYHNNQVRFIRDIGSHLAKIEIDRKKLYHIGTGQSSDSLMWGNRHGLLDSLCDFAERYPNVILEMKSKSGRTDFFQRRKPPFNMVFTWSLNPPVVIRFEEKGAAGLEKRLAAARTMANMNCPVGFHFHPIIWYEGWQNDYRAIVSTMTEMFSPDEVVMVSLGTLTFIKPVIKRIRKRLLKSSILQMPMEECGGKLSYPLEIKKDLFSTVYNAFPAIWKRKVFFYMCMEDISLWQPVFGRFYATNEAFEEDMAQTYMEKIRSIHTHSLHS